MDKQTKQVFTKRKSLCGESRHRPKKVVDMELVYQDLNRGMTLESVAKKHEVSASTLRRRHKEYQNEIESMEENGYELPPLPTNI